MAFICRGLFRPTIRQNSCLSRFLSTGNVAPSSCAAVSLGEKDKIFSKVEIELRAHQPEVLSSYNWFANTAAKHLDVDVAVSKADKEPHILRKTLLRSVFAVSKHRVQYEIRTYYSYLTVQNITGSTAGTYLEYIQRNLPEGVAMKVTKYERRPLVKLSA